MAATAGHFLAYQISLETQNKLGCEKLGVWASQKAHPLRLKLTNKLKRSLWNCPLHIDWSVWMAKWELIEGIKQTGK